MEASPRLIAIVGGSGSGKSWLAERLSRVFGPFAARLALDDFYRDWSHLDPAGRERVNFDHPRAIDWPRFTMALEACRAGMETVPVPRYCFETHRRLPEVEWRPAAVVIVEGLWLLRPRLRDAFAVRIFLDCPADVRLRRRMERDLASRGRTAESVRRQLEETVLPMHAVHVAPQTRWADVVLKHPLDRRAMLALADRLWERLASGGWHPAASREAFRSELCRVCEMEE